VAVVVVGKGSSAAVKAAGGKVTHRVRMIDGLIAEVPSRTVRAMRRARGVPADATTLDEVRTAIGADRLAATGDGVDGALIDSGITPVEGLAAPGQIVNRPDFSFDNRNPDLRHLDAFGHGTHLAGIIAGVAAQAPWSTSRPPTPRA
jgi:subtilisin family serine protease